MVAPTKPLPDHWPLGPSSASRWLKCPGSAGASSESSEAADVGTLSHAIAEQLLSGAKEVMLTMKQGELFNSLESERRMNFIDAVNTCVNYVRSIRDDYDVCILETKVQSLTVGPHGGTVDVILATETTLHVIDFKFGYVPVDAEDNDQLQCYLNLATQKFPGRKVKLGTIVQPAHRGADTAEFTNVQLSHHLSAVLVVGQLWVKGNPPRYADVEHCKYCPLLGGDNPCKEAATLMVDSVKEFPDLIEFTSQVQPEGPTREQIEQVERFYMIQKLAKTAYESSGILLKKWAKQGKPLRHHRVAKVTRTYWKEDARTALEGQDFEAEDYQVDDKPSLKTPAQVRATLGMDKKQFAKVFANVLEFRETPTLKAAKTKPSFDELAEFDTPLPFKE